MVDLVKFAFKYSNPGDLFIQRADRSAIGDLTKAKGIFEDYNDLLVAVMGFKTDNDLLNKFLRFNERTDELKDHLERIMPEYIDRAYLAKKEQLKII